MRKATIEKINNLKKLMKTDFFENYTEQEKQNCIKALLKDLEG
jgi:hypothetical protein